MRHLGIIIWTLLVFLGISAKAQEKEGIVFDSYTAQRVSRVYIYNTANDAMKYNNSRGEFSIDAKAGDTLIAVAKGYHPDTMIVRQTPVLIVKLNRATIWLDEVSIMARRSPAEVLENRKEDFRDAYRKGDPGSIFSVGPSGAGISIDALFSLLSREGKNARYLQELIQREYENNLIDSRFTPDLVKSLTRLNGGALQDFMQQYRPSYFFIQQANDYAMARYVQESYESYRKNPHAYRLPPLPKLLSPEDSLGRPGDTEPNLRP